MLLATEIHDYGDQKRMHISTGQAVYSLSLDEAVALRNSINGLLNDATQAQLEAAGEGLYLFLAGKDRPQVIADMIQTPEQVTWNARTFAYTYGAVIRAVKYTEQTGILAWPVPFPNS